MWKRRSLLGLLALLLLTSGCSRSEAPTEPKPKPRSFSGQSAPTSINISSPAFPEGGKFPVRYTCDGDNVSPPLMWSRLPRNATELVLFMDDTDAPHGFVHWVVFGIDPSVSGLAEGRLPEGARQAKGTSGEAGYVGPCPPRGDKAHRYVFSITALARRLDLPGEPSADRVMTELRAPGVGIIGGDTYADYKRR